MKGLWLMPALLGGCVVGFNDPPFFRFAEATCGPDAYGDFTWDFTAEVLDNDGTLDVIAVEAQVFEAGRFLERFPLDPQSDPSLWFSAWFEADTLLYCGAPYAIDFIAEDAWGHVVSYPVSIGGATVPYTYYY